ASALGIQQDAFLAQTATVTLNNSKLISAAASANATGFFVALAFDRALGVTQSASGSGLATAVTTAMLTNSGSIAATAPAHAHATYVDFAAAEAVGVLQLATEAKTAAATLNNSGSISATVTAKASPPTSIGRVAIATYASAAAVAQF